MGNSFFNEYPYTDFHELNLSWVIKELRSFATTLEQFVSINALKYADPIQWNITSQYEKNTIVIDPQSGTAYISVKAVPAGVALTDTNYWTVVFDIEQFVTKANNNFTLRVEPLTTLNATFATNAGQWVIWGGILYEALSNIIPGDQYVENSNIKRITVEDITGDLPNLSTNDKTNLVNAINEIFNGLGNLNNLQTTDKTSLVAAINEVLGALLTEVQNRIDGDDALQAKIGDLNNLQTTDKTSVVSAINEVNAIASAANYYVTPEDYGAQGGGADDTAAVQAAINDGRPVLFTQNYSCQKLTIPYDVTRSFYLDGNDFWIRYIGTPSDEGDCAIEFQGVTATIKNLNVINTTSDRLIGIWWTSTEVSKPSEFNTLENIKVYNFSTGILYRGTNGIDTSQSENSLIGYITRGCELPFYCNIDNGIINISNSQLVCHTSESTYTWNDSRCACLRNDGGIVNVVNSSLVKPIINTGYGIFGCGHGVVIDDCIIEFACPWAFVSGYLTLAHIRGGYYSNVNSSPFVIDEAKPGVLKLDDVHLRFATLSNVTLFKKATSGGTSNSVLLLNSRIDNVVNSYNSPLSDFPIVISGTSFNSPLVTNLNTYYYNYYNSAKLTPTNATLVYNNDGSVTVSATSTYPNIVTPDFLMGTMLNVVVNVKSMTGVWSLYAQYKTHDGTTGTVYIPLSVGTNAMTLMFGGIDVRETNFMIHCPSMNTSITYDMIQISAQGEA